MNQTMDIMFGIYQYFYQLPKLAGYIDAFMQTVALKAQSHHYQASQNESWACLISYSEYKSAPKL